MIRIVIENVLLFLLPSLAYVAYRMLLADKAGGAGRVLDDAPFVWLFVAGAMMVLIALVVFASNSGGRPGEAYVPPVLRDGQIVPGHRIGDNEQPAVRPSTIAPQAAPAPPAAPATTGRGG